MSEPWQLGAAAIARMVGAGELSAEELAEAHIERALGCNDRLGAFLHIEPADIRRQARALDRHIAMGHQPGALAGVPVALKDNICVRGMPTTCGSRMLETFVAPYDAHVVERLRSAGAILFGKTNMDEFGMGSSTEHSAFGPARNPYALERTPGGSSGGAAAAVAAGLVPVALGSDTGGSIRQPASYCGIVGLKPTYGLVSRWGLVAFASSLDQIGPLARDVGDLRLVLEAIAGHDPRDATSSVRLPGRVPEKPGLRGVRVGLPAEFFAEGLAREVRACVGSVRSVLAGKGAELVDVSLPLCEHALAAYYLIAPAEASSNLARYDGVRYGLRHDRDTTAATTTTTPEAMSAATRGRGFGAEAKRRILLGTFALSAGHQKGYYGRAQRLRAALRKEFEEVFRKVDVLLTPSTPTVAFVREGAPDPLAMYAHDRFTVPANLAGIPAVALPCGRRSDGLPIGLQLMAARFGDALLLRVAQACEAALDAGHEWPPEEAR